MGILDAPAAKGPLSPRGNGTIAWLGDSLTANGSSPGVWVGTVNTAAAAGATNLVVDYPYSAGAGFTNVTPPAANATLVLEPGTSREEYVVASAVTGSGPYTLTVPALTYAHAAGSPARAVLTKFDSQSVPMWTTFLSNNRLRYGGIFAHGGYTTQQIIDIYLPQILALNPLPGIVVMNVGTNDNYDLTAALPKVVGIIDTLRKRGILPVVTGAPPNGGNAPIGSDTAMRLKWNTALSSACVTRGVPYVDVFSPLADPAHGGMKLTYGQDNTHPSSVGAKVWAQAIVNALATAAPFYTDPGGMPMANVVNFDTTTFPFNVNNALLMTDTNADGVPDGYTKQFSSSGGDVSSLVTEAGVPGKMLSSTRGANATGNNWTTAPVTLIPGKKYRAYIRLKTSGLDAAYNSQLGTVTGGVQTSSFQGFDLRMIVNNGDHAFSLTGWKLDIPLSLITFDFVAPSNPGGNAVSWALILNGGSTTPAYTVQAWTWLANLTQIGAA